MHTGAGARGGPPGGRRSHGARPSRARAWAGGIQFRGARPPHAGLGSARHGSARRRGMRPGRAHCAGGQPGRAQARSAAPGRAQAGIAAPGRIQPGSARAQPVGTGPAGTGPAGIRPAGARAPLSRGRPVSGAWRDRAGTARPAGAGGPAVRVAARRAAAGGARPGRARFLGMRAPVTAGPPRRREAGRRLVVDHGPGLRGGQVGRRVAQREGRVAGFGVGLGGATCGAAGAKPRGPRGRPVPRRELARRVDRVGLPRPRRVAADRAAAAAAAVGAVVLRGGAAAPARWLPGDGQPRRGVV